MFENYKKEKEGSIKEYQRINMKIITKNELEEKITSDLNYNDGIEWGKPRNGHPEGKVIFHVIDVLNNVEKYYFNDLDYEKLRLIALIHDSFKNKVDNSKHKVGENHHAMIARRFAEKYINDIDILDVIELHDESYNSWSMGNRKNNWSGAETRIKALIKRLNTKKRINLYNKFYKCDFTDGKENHDYIWFQNFIK